MTAAFDTISRSVDAAMVVVTTAVDGERAGCLVGFHGQSSIERAHYAIWLSKANHTYRVGLRADHFGVHFLAESDHSVARHFGTRSGDSVDKFADVSWHSGAGGVPLLDDCPRYVVVRRLTMLDDGGDHVCVTGAIVEAVCGGEFNPLRMSEVADLDPGHEAGDRAIGVHD